MGNTPLENLFLFLLFLLAIIRVAFFTLLERKIIASIQFRQGPNRAVLQGLIQPLLDVLKLFSKTRFAGEKSDILFYVGFPVISTGTILFLWSILPTSIEIKVFNWSVIIILAISSITGMRIILRGWRRRTPYSLLGRVRALVQFSSYEIVFSFVVFCSCVIVFVFNVFDMISERKHGVVVWGVWLFLLIFFCVLAETQRSPFDFAEGERELVRGFNTEYNSVFFSLIFLSEYGISLIITILIGRFIISLESSFFLILVMGCLASIIIVIRCSFPRFRFDILQQAAWKIFLPISMVFLSIFCIST
jgi:NADH-ubiquinone oxidoreductase chain 1